MYNNTDLQQCQVERGGDQSWKSPGDRSLSRWSCKTRNHNFFWRMSADLARDQHRRGGRVFLTFPWNWNVLTTWPSQSVINEAPFLCAREGKKGILTNCADTARLVGRSRCCKSLVSRRLVQSSLANLSVCVPMRCICGTFQFRKTRCDSCDRLDDEEATAFPSDEDEAMREWREEFS